MRINAKKLIYFQIFFSLWLNFMVTTMGFPNSLAYLGDGINVLILILMRYSFIKKIKNFRGEGFGIIAFLMGLVLLIGIIGNMVNPFYIIWGIRNNFRYILFWLLCIAAFDAGDEKRLFGILEVLFNVNILFVLVQRLVFGLHQDFLGGMFGTFAGSNSRMNIFLCAVICYKTAQFIEGKISGLRILWILAVSLVIAAFAEMKFLFFEVVFIVVLTVLISKTSKKAYIILASTVLAMVAGLYVLREFDPLTFSIISDPEKIMAYGKMESGGYNISRFDAFETIEELFFRNNLFHRLFGFGIGNTDTSTVAMFNSVFYQKYGFLHYTWFSHQQWFLETGYFGFSLVVLFLGSMIIYAFRHADELRQNRALFRFCAVFPAVLIINLWYNNGLRLESAYMSFACLALLPGRVRESREKEKMEGVVEHDTEGDTLLLVRRE